MRSDTFRFITLCLCIIAIAIALTHLPHAPTTGAAVSVAQGGNVTQVHLYQPDQVASLWRGIFGNFTQTADNNGTINSSITLDLSGASPQVTAFNIALFNCTRSEIYATLENVTTSPGNGYLNSLTPATRADVNTFIGSSGTDMQSASTTFPLNISFEVGNNVHTLIANRINPATSNFTTGVLKRPGSGILVFVGSIRYANGFLGTPTMYQLLLPQPNSSTLTWYFFIDSTDDDVCPFGELNITRQPPQPEVPGEGLLPPGHYPGGAGAAGPSAPGPSAPAFGRGTPGASATPRATPRSAMSIATVVATTTQTQRTQRVTEVAVAIAITVLTVIALLVLMQLSML